MPILIFNELFVLVNLQSSTNVLPRKMNCTDGGVLVTKVYMNIIYKEDFKIGLGGI